MPTHTAPLLDPCPEPPCKTKAPPDTILLPDLKLVGLLLPLVPLPEPSTNPPARPPDAAPDASITAPLFPSLADPELNTRCPLDPPAPEFPVRTIRLPLLVADPSPEVTSIMPPLRPRLRPA